MRPGAFETPVRRAPGPATLVFDLGGVVFRWRPDEFLPRLASGDLNGLDASTAGLLRSLRA